MDPATGAWTVYSTVKPASSRVTYSGAAFAQPDGTTTSTCYFYARGSATKGTVLVVRVGSSKQYTVAVEGLTARVSFS